MRAARLCIACLIVLAAAAAGAGPWPRDAGTTFLSFGAEGFPGEGVAPTLYLEHGLTARLTVGFDGYLTERLDGAGFAFVRLPLLGPDGRHRIAAGLGVGGFLRSGGAPQPAARATLHWGAGLERGWLAVDAEIAAGFGADLRPAKIDATWGLRLDDDWTAILLATAGRGPDGTSHASVSPSLAWQASERLTLRLGVSRRIAGDTGTGVTAQAWLTF